MQKKKRESKVIPRLLAGKVLGDILNLHMESHIYSTKQNYFIVAISGIILTGAVSLLSMSEFLTLHILSKFGIIMILGGALFSILISVIAEKPSQIKASKTFHPMAFGEVDQISAEKYKNLLGNLVADEKKIVESYAYQILDLKHKLSQKTKKVRLSTSLLLIGLILGFGLITIAFIIAGKAALPII